MGTVAVADALGYYFNRRQLVLRLDNMVCAKVVECCLHTDLQNTYKLALWAFSHIAHFGEICMWQ